MTDDGVMRLMPEYTVQHVQGTAHTKVYAAFSLAPTQANVRLSERGGVTVNGHPLSLKRRSNGWYYEGEVPASIDALVFEVKRPAGRHFVDRLELPVLTDLQTPEVYASGQKLLVPVAYTAPPVHVTADIFSMSIMTPVFRFDLVSKAQSKTSRYQFDRLPEMADGAIVFTPLSPGHPPVGLYNAELYRQQRVSLGGLASDPNRLGWATLSNTVHFTILIK